MSRLISFSIILLTLLLSACGADQRIDPKVCEDVGEMKVVCGVSNPEDMVLLPDGKTLLVSEYGNYFLANPGQLALYDTQTGAITRLPELVANDLPQWGSPSCPSAPGASLSPHGLDLSIRPDGALQLLVVNHGGQERIDFVELLKAPQGYSARWRGCVIPPEDSYINSVASTPEGGMIFTHMYAKSSPRLGTTALAVALSTLGRPSGYAMEWQLEDGEDRFSIIEGSRDGFPNGLLIDKSGKYLFMAASTGGRIIKIDRATGQLVGEVPAKHPDNIRWDSTGNILAATMPVSSLTGMLCQEESLKDVNCGAGYEILRIDPATMQVETIFSHAGGQPMGVATVAQQVGSSLYIGSFAGNRIVKVPYVP